MELVFHLPIMVTSPERNYYTMSEAAVRLGMSSKQVSDMVRHGTIPDIHRMEGCWVVFMDALPACLNRNSNDYATTGKLGVVKIGRRANGLKGQPPYDAIDAGHIGTVRHSDTPITIREAN